MSDINKEILDKIKDGSYYKDAKEWYYYKYLTPIVERSYITIILILVIFAAFISINFIIFAFPISKEVPFTITTDNTDGYYTTMTPVDKDGETPQEAIVRYLVVEYLKNYEEYSYTKMQGNNLRSTVKKIKNTSTNEVYKNYMTNISRTNPNSPLIKFRRNITKEIEISDFTLLENYVTSGKVKVKFKAIIVNNMSKQKVVQNGEATIEYRIPDIESIAKTGSTVRFQVTYYNVAMKQ